MGHRGAASALGRSGVLTERNANRIPDSEIAQRAEGAFVDAERPVLVLDQEPVKTGLHIKCDTAQAQPRAEWATQLSARGRCLGENVNRGLGAPLHHPKRKLETPFPVGASSSCAQLHQRAKPVAIDRLSVTTDLDHSPGHVAVVLLDDVPGQLDRPCLHATKAPGEFELGTK